MHHDSRPDDITADQGSSLGVEDVQAYLNRHHIVSEIIFLSTDTPTVEQAAQALGVKTDQIAKSLLFLAAGEPVLVIGCGTVRIDKTRVAAYLGTPSSATKLAPPALVLAETGFSVGTMPPFAQRRRLRTLIDSRVLEQEMLYAGGGGINSMLRITPSELVRATQGVVVQVA